MVHRDPRILHGNSYTFTCAGHQTSPATIDIKKVELGGMPWNPLWDQIIEKALPPEMLFSQAPRGVRLFCPRFYEIDKTDKRTFWAYFFQALAGAEAGLNPNTSVHHTEPERTMAMRSEGLLQLAYADEKRKPLLTRSGYWSTLRPDEPSYLVFAKQMTNPPAACGLPTKSRIDKSATTKSVQDDANRGETPK